MPRRPDVQMISGLIHYQGTAATLQESDGSESLLVLDKPPLGYFDVEDIAAAASLFRDFLNKRDGDRISVFGIRGRFISRPSILIIRA